jgi:hypothetical protein
MTRLLLDPTNERTVLERSLLPPGLDRGKTIGCSTSPSRAAMCS